MLIIKYKFIKIDLKTDEWRKNWEKEGFPWTELADKMHEEVSWSENSKRKILEK